MDGRVILTMDFEEVDGDDVDWVCVWFQDSFHNGVSCEHGNETTKFMKRVNCFTFEHHVRDI